MTDIVEIIQQDTLVVDGEFISALDVEDGTVGVLDVIENEIVLVENEVIAIIDVGDDSSITVEDEVITIISDAAQGPQGISGDSVVYAVRADVVSDELIYKGQAAPGSLESSPVWRISRVTILNDLVTEEWAGGLSTFSNTWANRSLLSYS